MTQGFIALNSDGDALGKSLDNDIVLLPPGTQISDQFGNLVTLAGSAYVYRERITNADPTNPAGVATVRDATGPNINEFGLSVRMPSGQADLQTIAALLLDIDTNIAALAGTTPLTNAGQVVQNANFLFPSSGVLPSGVVSPDIPRRQICDIFGRAITVPMATRDMIKTFFNTITSSTAATGIVSAPAGFFLDITAITAINTSATATEFDVTDGTQTLQLYLPAGDMRGVSFGITPLYMTQAGQTWAVQCGTSVASVKFWFQCILQRAI